MDFGKLTLFQAMQRKMDWLTKRQEVLAQNVANADTPDFSARDLKEFTFRNVLDANRERLAATRTHAAHMAPGKVGAARRLGIVEEPSYETSPDGNAVVVEEQLMKLTETSADHQMVINLYRKHLAMVRAVLGRNG